MAIILFEVCFCAMDNEIQKLPNFCIKTDKFSHFHLYNSE